MDPAIGCLILLGVMALLFITELIPLAVTAMGGAIICGFLNFIPDVCCGCGNVSYRACAQHRRIYR